MIKMHCKEGFTLVEIMIVVAIIALLAAIAIPNLLRAKMAANDTTAKATLRSIANSAEIFFSANSGSYPADMTSLTSASGTLPAYLSTDYCNATRSGYTFECTSFSTTGYVVKANPNSPGISGTTTYTIQTTGLLTP